MNSCWVHTTLDSGKSTLKKTKMAEYVFFLEVG